jgi:catechol 2,3-dioxygenase-like lactoylglutathione lyase family enzyme
MYSVTHIALRVTNLREAEAYYCDLFGLEVAWREAETTEGWRRLPQGKTWDEAEVAGIQLGIVMLHRDGLALALEPHASIPTEGQLSHIGLLVDEPELSRLRHYAPQVGGRLVHDDHNRLSLMTTTAYDGNHPPTRIQSQNASARGLRDY